MSRGTTDAIRDLTQRYHFKWKHRTGKNRSISSDLQVGATKCVVCFENAGTARQSVESLLASHLNAHTECEECDKYVHGGARCRTQVVRYVWSRRRKNARTQKFSERDHVAHELCARTQHGCIPRTQAFFLSISRL